MENDRLVKKPELLAPAGSPEVLRVAVHYGADAVYIGGDAFGLRANAKNFSREEMAEAGEELNTAVQNAADNAAAPASAPAPAQ